MGQILAIVSSKGGVGKTTTAVNLAAAFASLDFPTLLIEADPQCGLVANFGYDRFDIPRGLADVARGECRIQDTTFETPVPGLHVVSSNVWSQEEEALYLGALERDPLVLRRAFAELAEGYDYLMIDAPPMLGPITLAILAAADRFLVPVQAEPQSVRALARLMETSVAVRDRFNPKLRFDGIALTMVDGRTRMSQQLEDSVRREWPDQVFRATVPRSIRLAEVHPSGRPLVLAAPASRGARAYAGLAEEILMAHARERAMARAMEGVTADDESVDPMDPVARVDDGASTNRMADFLAALSGNGGRPANGSSRDEAPRAAAHADSSELTAALALPAEEEWDERFVDLETYLEIESGGSARTAVADDDWDEDDWQERDDA
ncbi:MAG TPA: ParA family protein [Candidatus Eisenbacteria bacterium]